MSFPWSKVYADSNMKPSGTLLNIGIFYTVKIINLKVILEAFLLGAPKFMKFAGNCKEYP